MSLIIIGAGDWGTALVGLVSPAHPIRLWCRSDESRAKLNRLIHEVAGVAERQVTVERMFASKLEPSDTVLMALPSAQVVHVARQIRDGCAAPYPIIVSASKGLERETFRTMSQLISDVLPGVRVAALSGPNIASEIRSGRPARAVLGCSDVRVLMQIADLLGSDRFHLEMTLSCVDVELCGAMKGVFAIGAGIIEERDWGTNFVGLLIARAVREVMEVARFLRIPTDHVLGVAGLADLVATATSPCSRNFRFGRLLAAGATLDEALERVGMVVEGVMVAEAVAEMLKLRLRVPLFSAIAAVIRDPGDATVNALESVLIDSAAETPSQW